MPWRIAQKKIGCYVPEVTRTPETTLHPHLCARAGDRRAFAGPPSFLAEEMALTCPTRCSEPNSAPRAAQRGPRPLQRAMQAPWSRMEDRKSAPRRLRSALQRLRCAPQAPRSRIEDIHFAPRPPRSRPPAARCSLLRLKSRIEDVMVRARLFGLPLAGRGDGSSASEPATRTHFARAPSFLAEVIAFTCRRTSRDRGPKRCPRCWRTSRCIPSIWPSLRPSARPC